MPFAASRLAAIVASVVAAAVLPATASAATTYTSPTAFLNSVGASLTDDYQNPAYDTPDKPDGTFTDAAMSQVIGETQYRTTGIAQHNFVEHQPGQVFYCAGCNGSFELDFTATSIGDAGGVYGVGFNVVANQLASPYVAFVTYGDSTTENFSLPIRNLQTPLPSTIFWGITSDKKIRSIHFGGYGGVAVTTGGFAMDNLVIAAAPAPADTDGDGVADASDNCTLVANPTQYDANTDGYGNICDGDLDQSGFVNFTDLALFRAAFGTVNAAADFNGTGGFVNLSDYAIFRSMFGKAPGPSGLHP